MILIVSYAKKVEASARYMLPVELPSGHVTTQTLGGICTGKLSSTPNIYTLALIMSFALREQVCSNDAPCETCKWNSRFLFLSKSPLFVQHKHVAALCSVA